MKAFGLTDKGRKREKNEDTILVNPEINLFIVADGMGGHALGEFASQSAVRIINEVIEESIFNGDEGSLKKDEHIKVLLTEAIGRANKEIYTYSQNLSEKSIIGTTVSLALFKNKKLYTAHVGDSRIYRLRKDNLEKLTKDHSKARELIDAGLLKEEEAEHHRSSHILTKALGSALSVVPDINVHDMKNGDSFLLSTDGLFRAVDINNVKNIMMSKLSVEEKCRSIVGKALENDAPDNVSVIILEPSSKGLIKRIFS